MNNYIVVDQTEAENEDGTIKIGYEKRAYCYVKLIPILPTYADLRRPEYPPMADLNDALVKQRSSDLAIVAEGQAQEIQYYSDCLQVKAKYPKP